MRYLLDTNIVVAALRSRRGASHELLRRAILGELPVAIHHKLLAEYRDVLGRPDILAVLALSEDEVEKVLARLAFVAEEVRVRYLWRPNLRDEGDNFVLEIAVAAAPCTVVTHNVGDFLSGDLRFQNVWIKTPQQVLLELAKH